MDRLLPTAIIGAVIVLAVIGMFLGWRARVRKYSAFVAPDSVPESFGDIVTVDQGLYVATTLAGQPLERVAAHGLGFRARASVTITTTGLVVAPIGRQPFFIDRASIVAVDRATWAIDKVVEPGGLVVVTWRLGDAELDSYFRMDHGPEVLLNAGAELIEGLA